VVAIKNPQRSSAGAFQITKCTVCLRCSHENLGTREIALASPKVSTDARPDPQTRGQRLSETFCEVSSAMSENNKVNEGYLTMTPERLVSFSGSLFIAVSPTGLKAFEESALHLAYKYIKTVTR
jgi:hypothetical protein